MVSKNHGWSDASSQKCVEEPCLVQWLFAELGWYEPTVDSKQQHEHENAPHMIVTTPVLHGAAL
eukprot:11131466-Lingulodinium_polyedra.AAC.1